jgi:uncharacterized membrane protein
MAWLDRIRHRGGRAVIRIAVTVIAALAVATPASAGASAQQQGDCPRPEAGDGYVYRNGRFRRLWPVPDAEFTVHFGINDRRQTVGTYVDEGAELGPDCIYPPEASHAFLQDRWGRVSTIDVPGGDSEFPAGGVNDRGQVAGVYIDANAVPDPDGVFPPRGSVHGFIRERSGRITTFDVEAPRMHAVTDINDRGQVVGYVDESFTTGSGFLRDPDRTITRIEIPGANYTQPRGINNRGQVVGSYEVGDRNPDGTIPPGRIHGFIWDDGEITTFDVPRAASTDPTHINNQGDIVGGYRDATGQQHGFLLRRGRYTTINAPRRTDNIAWGLNDRGDIVIPEPGLDLGPIATGSPSQRTN